MPRRQGSAAATLCATTEAHRIAIRISRAAYLKEQLELARREAAAAAGLFQHLCRAPSADLLELAASSEDTAVTAGRVRAFATLLARE
jgi:hypothetical protein